jgi:hypothetical protein
MMSNATIICICSYVSLGVKDNMVTTCMQSVVAVYGHRVLIVLREGHRVLIVLREGGNEDLPAVDVTGAVSMPT